MSLSLHAALVPSWLQYIGSGERLVTKAQDWSEENGLEPADILSAALAEDMLPFAYQIKSMWTHSSYAAARASEGVFLPETSTPPDSFAGLHEKLAQARQELEALDPQLLDTIADKEMLFKIGDKVRMPFTVRNFLLSFSQPNFYFHTTTAYAILRVKGLKLGKLDYLGALPVNS